MLFFLSEIKKLQFFNRVVSRDNCTCRLITVSCIFVNLSEVQKLNNPIFRFKQRPITGQEHSYYPGNSIFNLVT